MSTPTNERRSIWIPSPLWERVQRAAREESVRRGKRYTAADFVREALEALLERGSG